MDNIFLEFNLKQKNDSDKDKNKIMKRKLPEEIHSEESGSDLNNSDSEIESESESESDDSFIVSDDHVSYMSTSSEETLTSDSSQEKIILELESGSESSDYDSDEEIGIEINITDINNFLKKKKNKELIFFIEELQELEELEELETKSDSSLILRKRNKNGEILNSEHEKIKEKIKEKNKELEEFKNKQNPYQLTIEDKILLSNFDIATKNELLSKWKNIPKYGEESSKLKQWFSSLFNLPINKYKPLPICKESSPEEIENFLVDAKTKLDQVVYGMEHVKEEILSFIIKKINGKETKGTILALHGPKGTAKCLAPGTKILLSTGEIIKVEDVKIGDHLLGDESQTQTVLSTATGYDYMYKIIPKYGMPYTVNKEHILCLKHIITKKILEIPVKKFIELPFLIRKLYRGYKNPLHFPEKKLDIDPYIIGYKYRDHLSAKIDNIILYNSWDVRFDFLAGLLSITPNIFRKKSNYTRFTIRNFEDQKGLYFLIHSLGMTVIKATTKKIVFVKENKTDPIKIKSAGLGRYYGFELGAGNGRFVLQDCTVSHNTRIARKGIAEVLNLPFHSINFGGLKDSSVLLGHDFTYSGSTYGKIAQILMKSGYMNNIIYLDEIDKVSSEAANEIFGVLTHLLDEEQNYEFEDNYFKGIKLDLSKTFFIISFNDLQYVNHITADRMRIIDIKPPNNKEKIKILKDIVIPEVISQNYNKNLDILWSEESIKYLISKFPEEGMMRNIREAIKQIVEKINLCFFSKGKFIPEIYKYLTIVETKTIININNSVIDYFIKNKEENISHLMMYL